MREIETCAVCGVEHEDGVPCPYGVTDVCPVCAELECICDILEEFPLGPDTPDLPEESAADYWIGMGA